MFTIIFMDNNNMSQPKYDNMHSEQNFSTVMTDDDMTCYNGSSAFYEPARPSDEASPLMMSPWNQTQSYNSDFSNSQHFEENVPQLALIGSLTRQEGHVYSLAASGTGILYTGSDSKNIRVWKNLEEFSGFKSCSGLVKAIIIANGKVYTGHQDGKIRVWKVSRRNPAAHKISATLPTLKEILRRSIKPSNYVEVRRHHTSLWIKHSDVVSCLSINEDQTLLYSASWDKTVKVWSLSDSKCLESIHAHHDAVNSVIASVDGLVYTGSADGTVKVWKREKSQGKARTATKHALSQTLLKQDSSVTALATNTTGSFLYCGSSDGLVNFWVRETMHDQFSHSSVLKGHKLAVLCLAAAGSLVFSGSADKTICVWRRDHRSVNHMCLTVLRGHTGPVKCLTVEKDSESESDGKTWILYSGSLDKSVKIWSVRDVDRTDVMYQMGYDGDSVPSDGSFSSARGASRRR